MLFTMLIILNNLTSQPIEGMGLWSDPNTMVGMSDQNGMIDVSNISKGVYYIFSYDMPEYYVNIVNLTNLMQARSKNLTVYMSSVPDCNCTYDVHVCVNDNSTYTYSVYYMNKRGDNLQYSLNGTGCQAFTVPDGMFKVSVYNKTHYDYDMLFANSVDPVLNTTLYPVNIPNKTVCYDYHVYDIYSGEDINGVDISPKSGCIKAGVYTIHAHANGYKDKNIEYFFVKNRTIDVGLERGVRLNVKCNSSKFYVDGKEYLMFKRKPKDVYDREIALTSGVHEIVCNSQKINKNFTHDETVYFKNVDNENINDENKSGNEQDSPALCVSPLFLILITLGIVISQNLNEVV